VIVTVNENKLKQKHVNKKVVFGVRLGIGTNQWGRISAEVLVTM
jgi:hypothetical protein